MSQSLALSLAGLAGAIVIVLVDGRRAVPIAAMAAALGLLPTANTISGSSVGINLIVVGLVVATVEITASVIASHLPWIDGLDPTVPLFHQPGALFGPRSSRVAAGVLALPIASWVSFNIPVGGVAGVEGLLFGTSYIWCCGAARIITARTVEDLGVGMVAIVMAGATGWFVSNSASGGSDVLVLLAIAPLTGVVTGWWRGRHHRRAAA